METMAYYCQHDPVACVYLPPVCETSGFIQKALAISMAVRPNLDFCLLMPCFNNEEGLIRSLRTVNYTGGPFMVLAVDDGSAVPVSPAKIQHGIGMGMRVEVLRLEHNQGITNALNAGLAWILEHLYTEFVARLDCADVCDPSRFDKQVLRMRSDPGLVLTGTWCFFRDYDTGEQYRYITAISNENIIREMYHRNVFIHPTVMFRTSMLGATGFYPKGFELAEDYAFFWTLMKHGKVGMIAEFLVTCEINKRGISFANKGKQLAARWRVVSSFGVSGLLKLRGFLRLAGLFLLPKGLILWLKKKKA
ncbi:MAG: glycosyltransferase [Chitinophagaceae bacterium]|nr:MAG: glycosyltransferase [Chitinophagaceae bacterium]